MFNVNTAKAFGLSFPPGLIAIARALRASAMTTPRTGAGFQRPGADRFRVFALSAVAGEAGPPQHRKNGQNNSRRGGEGRSFRH